MRKREVIVAACTVVVALAGLLLRPVTTPVDAPPPRVERRQAAVRESLLPLPALAQGDLRKIRLGKRLFNDPRLSADQSISCSSCHVLDHGGVDGVKFSSGIGGQLGVINAPTVWNSGLNFRQFWDGRARTLEEQVDGPVEHPAEMGSTWRDVVQRLERDASFSQDFAAVYAGGITRENIKDAIATFERALVTPNARFDRFLLGDAAALSEQETEGFRLFNSLGCVSCHQGVNVGGNMFQRLGVMGDYFAGREITRADLGRFNVTGRERDRHRFKVPGLRNVARTAPYFHDGATATLAEAVRVMARYQLGRTLSESEVASIVGFLGTLDGDLRVP